MAETLLPLRQLLEGLCRGHGMHICVHDISGVLSSPMLALPYRFRTHDTTYCDAAKGTPRGYRVCLRCKTLANDRAQRERALFCGPCCYGVFKVAQPVEINGRVACIVYLGNLSLDRAREAMLRESACSFTGVSAERLRREAEKLEPVENLEMYLSVARRERALGGGSDSAVRRGVVAADDSVGGRGAAVPHQPAVRGAAVSPADGLHLSRIPEHPAPDPGGGAAAEKNVLEIALDCGFPTVTYFNRLFLRQFGKSPTAYRQEE